MHVIQSRSAAEVKNLVLGLGSPSFADNEILRFALNDMYQYERYSALVEEIYSRFSTRR